MVSNVPSSIETPFNVSFSVAKAVTCLGPFQSNVEAIIASVKSPLGSQSVHCLCPWNPPAIAFLPLASSSQPSSDSFSLPNKISRIIIACFAINSQSLSGGTTFDFLII